MRLIDADTLVDAMTGACNIFDAHEVDTTIARTLITVAAKAPTVGGWISVKDRLPEEGKTVLVARKYIQPGHKERRYVETAERIGLDWVSVEDEYKVHRQFHTPPYAWMPLPKPPEAD